MNKMGFFLNRSGSENLSLEYEPIDTSYALALKVAEDRDVMLYDWKE